MTRYRRKRYVPIIFALICISSTIIMFVQANETVTQKQTDVHLEVNSELVKDVELYLDGVKQAKKAIWYFDEVQIDSVGAYPGSIVYKDVEYPMTFYIEDTTKPVVDLSKNHFTFYVGTTLEEINDRVNQEIQIQDNYDHAFTPIQVVQEHVYEPMEKTYTFTVKDTYGNESEEVIVYVEFINKEETIFDSEVRDTPSSDVSSLPISPPSQSNKEEQRIPSQEERKNPESTSTKPEIKEETSSPNKNSDVVHEETLSSWETALNKADELTGWLDSPYAGYKYMLVPAQSGTVTLLILKE